MDHLQLAEFFGIDFFCQLVQKKGHFPHSISVNKPSRIKKFGCAPINQMNADAGSRRREQTPAIQTSVEKVNAERRYVFPLLMRSRTGEGYRVQTRDMKKERGRIGREEDRG